MNIEALNNIITENHLPIGVVQSYTQYPGGFSNITYAIETNTGSYVLRTPPPGAAIKGGHDMGREYKVLQLLYPQFSKVPKPIFYSEDTTVTSVPFYIMEKKNGLILRAQNAPQLNLPPETYQSLSETFIDTLTELHALDIETTGLIQLGKPEGYVKRQVEGWIKRYYIAETDTITAMNETAKWLQAFTPIEQAPAFLHNDYKYDNLILNEINPAEIVAILDWEMSTVGDPLMDVGAMLAYWFEPEEEKVLRMYNLTWLSGNYTKQMLIDRYAKKTGRNMRDIHFYQAFGLLKNAVIAQQIYHRWKQGHSNDPRFAQLLPLIQLLGMKAHKTIHDMK